MKKLAQMVAMTGLLLSAINIGGLTAVQAAGSNYSAATFVESACRGVNEVNDTKDSAAPCTSGGGTQLTKVIKAAIMLLSSIVGVAAIIAIIISGFKFITANGDANSVATARRTLIYAIVGLIIVASAQVIVRVALNTTT